MAKVDARVIQPHEYEEAPELTEEMLSRVVVKKGGRPVATNPRKLITIRLPADVIERWRAPVQAGRRGWPSGCGRSASMS